VQGLLLPGGRKSIEPLAERLRVDAQSLQQFIADSPWEADGVVAAPVLGDSGYGHGEEFRAGLRSRGLEFFLQVTGSILKGWTSEVPTIFKVRRRSVAPGRSPRA
jgi:SRSO17 transposase